MAHINKSRMDIYPGAGGDIYVTPIDNCGTYTVEAYPYSGYEFVRWYDAVTDNPRTITVSAYEDTRLFALFGKSSDLHPSGGDIQVQIADTAQRSGAIWIVDRWHGIVLLFWLLCVVARIVGGGG